jgi:hypothetical protein
MAGAAFVLPVTFNDPTLPILADDAILTTGSLALIDFAHSAAPVTGVPASGSPIPNIAWKQAAAAHGSGTQAEWAQTYTNNMNLAAGADGFVERSGKGGLHVAMSQATGTAGKGVVVGENTAAASNKLTDFLFAHLDDDYYFSLWQRITRVPVADTIEELVYSIGGNSSPTGNYLLRGSRTVNGGAGLVANSQPALPQPAGPSYRSMAQTAYTGTKPASANVMIAALMSVGWPVVGYTSFGANKGRSAVLYRCYLEDLTISGRTFAQVDALDKALYDQAFGAGGRYAGDTYTDPGTYP